MVTTIQIGERTMNQLKQLKKSSNASSYDEVIQELIIKSQRAKSFSGFLGKREDLPKILKELQEDRRKSDRF